MFMHSQLIQTRFTGIQDLTLALDMVVLVLVLGWDIRTGIHGILHTWAIRVTVGAIPVMDGDTPATDGGIRDMGVAILFTPAILSIRVRVIQYIPAIRRMVITTMAQGLQIPHRDV